MKIQSYKADGFVGRPDPACRVILVYGPDHGLMKERIKVAGKTVCADLNDPFNVVYIEAKKIQDDQAVLLDEAAAISMMGGKRLIIVNNADDGITTAVKTYLSNPNDQCLILLEGGALGAKSSIRGLCERDAKAAAVPCYVEEGEALVGVIKRMAAQDGYDIQQDAAYLLAESASGDRLRVRSEMEKLELYVGKEAASGKRPYIRIEDVMEVVADAGNRDLDDLIYAVAGRNPSRALPVLQKLSDEGTAAISIIRSLMNHFRRLHQAKCLINSGLTADQAMKSLSPPIFFKYEQPFSAQTHAWSLKSIEDAIIRLQRLEISSKRTGYPESALLGQAVLDLAS